MCKWAMQALPAMGEPSVQETPPIARLIPHAVGNPASPTTSKITKKNKVANVPLRRPIKTIYNMKYSNLIVRDMRNDERLYINKQAM